MESGLEGFHCTLQSDLLVSFYTTKAITIFHADYNISVKRI